MQKLGVRLIFLLLLLLAALFPGDGLGNEQGSKIFSTPQQHKTKESLKQIATLVSTLHQGKTQAVSSDITNQNFTAVGRRPKTPASPNHSGSANSTSHKPFSTPRNTTTTKSRPKIHLSTILFIAVPVVLLILLIVVTIFLVKFCRKKKSKKEVDPASENFNSPIFEEDTASVVEIEMEDLDMWLKDSTKTLEIEPLSMSQEETGSGVEPR
ncbi:transmembrane protein 154 isoform X2 [Latimeria chalumnae]|uniref:transmembrane protein 154 isoform X2 n=1 Tax=Latimeria chalumnae TaxID=7897 RepID=UPI0003C14187|nr:PREDICTED: transmembrane protein 154 isoform X2 [Latimeria chalumnae]|eukprot:XP_006005079.1 PREDICTED: transmembrane protein 154 isoform X2 [Latimeria chalumnae]